jgi:hypothetical protein
MNNYPPLITMRTKEVVISKALNLFKHFEDPNSRTFVVCIVLNQKSIGLLQSNQSASASVQWGACSTYEKNGAE